MPAPNCKIGFKDYLVNLAFFFSLAYNILKEEQQKKKNLKKNHVKENQSWRAKSKNILFKTIAIMGKRPQ